MIVLQNSENVLLLLFKHAFSTQYEYVVFTNCRDRYNLTSRDLPEAKPVVTKTAVRASQTQTKTGIDKETFSFL